jgi:DNA-directed RNA polymerase subunit RPC12/RpoP
MDEFGSYEDVRVNTIEETDKKCAECGGIVDFDPATGGLKCPYCGHVQPIDAPQSPDESARLPVMEADFESAEETGSCDWGAEKKSVVCKACGAESVYDALAISSKCPYCDSNQVMEAKGDRTLAPGGVCVFKVDSKQAGENFKKWISGKWFCPSEAKKRARPDSFTGIYLPYWTFDADTKSRYEGEYGICRRRKGKDGKEETYTEWHNTKGFHAEFIDDQLVSGIDPGRKDSSLWALAEPFNTADNVVYKPEYVAGFVAERYSVGLKDGWEKAKAFIADRLRGSIKRKIEYDNNADASKVHSVKTAYENVKYKYLLLPVWVSAFKYNGRAFQFVVNGQTGKVGGKTPISALRVGAAVLLAAAVIGAVWYFTQGLG